MKKIVYIVHAIDTEGPLYESTKATFERLESTFGIKLNPTYDNLQKLRNEEIKLNGIENEVAKFLEPTLQNYHDTWDKIESMLSKIMSKEFRFNIQIHSVEVGCITGFVSIMLDIKKILAIEILDTTMFMIGMSNS